MYCLIEAGNALIVFFSCLKGEFVSMGVISDGNSYGIPEDLIYSFPVVIKVHKEFMQFLKLSFM